MAKPIQGWRTSPSADLLQDIETCLSRYQAAGTKAFASDDGWAFLINDTSDFLRWQFGLKRWTEAQCDAANAVLRARVEQIGERRSSYFFFLVPEKSAVYSEYLPGLLGVAPLFAGRPALALHRGSDNNALYLLDQVAESRRICIPYFRGDTHPNWSGSWIIYRAIHATLSGSMDLGLPLGLESLTLKVGNYMGDLFSQLPEAVRADLPALFRLGLPGETCEVEFVLGIRNEVRKALPVEVPGICQTISAPRRALMWENSDTSLPRYVIFRDSTAQFCLDLLAHHFSRMVAIWRGGHVIEEIIERERPDIVLQIQAERFVFTLPNARPIVSVGGG